MSYANFRTLTIDHTKVPNADQANLPVLFTCQCDTLNGAVDASQTNFTFTVGKQLQNGDYFRIGSEICLVVSGGNTTSQTVARAQKSTTGASHSNGATVINCFLSSSANGGGVTSASGFDFIFALNSNGSSPIAFERVVWDAVNGVTEAWLLIPSASHTTDTVIYVLWGDSGVTTDQSTPATVWAAYKNVEHFGDGTTISVADSTGVNTPTNHGVTATAARIPGGAGSFNGTTEYVDVGNTNSNFTGSITLECWVLANTTATAELIGNQDIGGNNGYQIVLAVAGPQAVFTCFLAVTAATVLSQYVPSNATPLTTGTWFHILATIQAGGGANCAACGVYIDGNPTAPQSIGVPGTGVIGAQTQTLTLGQISTLFFGGKLDECRTGNFWTSADLAKAGHNSQSSPSTFFSLGVISAPSEIHASATLTGTGTLTGRPTVLSSISFPNIFIDTAAPGSGFTGQARRFLEGGQGNYTLTVNQRGTGSIEFYVAGTDSYEPAIGSPVKISQGLSPFLGIVQLFAGIINDFDKKAISDFGDRFITLALGSLELYFDNVRIPPRAYLNFTPGQIVTDLFNTRMTGVPITLGTIEDGPRIPLKVFGKWERVSDAYSDLAVFCGFQWYVDHETSELNFRTPTSDINPTSLLSTMIEWDEGLSHKENRADFRDSQIVELAQAAASISGSVFAGDNSTKDFILDYLVEAVISASITDSTQATATGHFTGQPSPGDTISLSFVPITGVATHFAIIAPGTVNGASNFTFTVTALDDANNVIVGYSGTVHFTANSPNVGGLDVLPGDSGLVSGTGMFTAKFQAGFDISTGGNWLIATDTLDPAVTGRSGSINVVAVP